MTAAAALPGNAENEDDDDDEEDVDDDDDDDEYGILDSAEPNISGKVKIEMKNGRVIEVEAKEYIQELKKEAEALKAALRREKSLPEQQQEQSPDSMSPIMGGPPPPGEGGEDQTGGI